MGSFGHFVFFTVKRSFSMKTSFSYAFLPIFAKWVRLVILCFWRSIIYP